MGADHPLETLTTNPGFLLSRVGTAIQTGFKELLNARSLRPLQLSILMLLDTFDGTSQQRLCQAAGIDSGNMVELVDELEALQYAKRTRDPADRRRYIVTITPAGRRTLTKVLEEVQHYTDDFLSPLSDTERRRLTAALEKLYASTSEGRRRAPSQEAGTEPAGSYVSQAAPDDRDP